MKIVYVSNSVIPSQVANSIHVMNMCSALARNGHAVTLLVPDRKEEKLKGVIDEFEFYNVEKNFKIVFMPYGKHKGKSILLSMRMLLYLLNNRPDFVYGRFVQACLLGALFGLKTIFESHSPINKSGFLERMSFNILRKMSNLKRLVVISSTLKTYYVETFRMKQNIVVVAHDSATIDNRNFKDIIDWPGRNKVLQVGYLGNLYHGKGIEIIIALANTVTSVDFHVVGGSSNDVQKWQNKNITNLFFHGFVPPQFTRNYLMKFDICLLPNQRIVFGYNHVGGKSENIAEFTSPLKLFEYMSCAKAIIASDLPVLREVLNDRNSVLVPCDDVSAWANAIEKLKSPILRDLYGKEAYSAFEKKHTWDIRAKDVMLNIC